MKTINTSSPHTRNAAHNHPVARDFKLHYLDLLPRETMNCKHQLVVQATAEFPLLADWVCHRIICAYTEERVSALGVNVETSSVTLQGWVERYGRMAGMVGWKVPSGFVARWMFRWSVYKRCTRTLFDESLSEAGLR